MGISNVIFYTLSFLAVYVQVFFLVTFLSRRKHIKYNKGQIKLKYYPSVSITIPCFNEEKTLEKTVHSLLDLDYPKNKFSVFLVDDGSTDNTWSVMQKFINHPNVKIFQKENGGKHTALNLALAETKAEFVGCLDSDSFVHNQALKRIMKYFEDDKELMAVAPSIIVHHPKNILQIAQKAEYDMSVYLKQMLGLIGGIHVTPGPFSIFRKKVFDELGIYRKAHNTEDQEIALRMQEHGYKIDHCPDAFVYTLTPPTVPKLYRQRLRWIYGFIKNMIDYRRLLFKKKYGSVALFTLPSGLVSITGTIFLFSLFMYNFGSFILKKIAVYRAIGFKGSFNFNFDWFFVDTKAVVFFTFILYILVVISVMIGRHMTGHKRAFSFHIFSFMIVYSLIAPFWLLKAIWNAIWSRESNWVLERKV